MSAFPGFVSGEFLNEYVSKLRIEKNGSITVVFVNGSVVSSNIGGEQFGEFSEKDYNANRSRSEKESGESRTYNTSHSGILPCINGRRVNIGETIKQQVRKYLKILKKVVKRRYFSCEDACFGLK